MAGTPISLYASFFSLLWQNPDEARKFVQLLHSLGNSQKLEQFLQVMTAVAGHEIHVREAEDEINEMLGNAVV